MALLDLVFRKMQVHLSINKEVSVVSYVVMQLISVSYVFMKIEDLIRKLLIYIKGTD